jgi:hypothetical protein
VPSRKGKRRLNPSARAEDDNSSGLVLRWAVRVTPLALRRTTAYESSHASRRTSTGGGSVRTPGNHAQPVGEGRQEIVLNCSPYLPWTYRHWSVGGRSQAHRRQALRRWCFPPSLVRGECFCLAGLAGLVAFVAVATPYDPEQLSLAGSLGMTSLTNEPRLGAA